MNFDAAVLIGRFQPFHAGHAALLARAFDAAPRVVLVLGSARSRRTPRNPFSAEEREAMVRATLSESDNARLSVLGQRDVWEPQRWSREVREAVESVACGRIALVGFHKDRSSAYLDLFPSWIPLETGRLSPLDATPLRERILSGDSADKVLFALSDLVPGPVADFLSDWMRGPWREELEQDARALREFERRHGPGPLSAVDVLVRCRGSVLLVERGRRPALGALALPGGLAGPGEGTEAAAARALRDKTSLSLHLAPVREIVFDHPGRSERARIATRALLYEPGWESPPPPQAGASATSARWVPESELPDLEDLFFEDHFHILDVFLGVVGRGAGLRSPGSPRRP